MRDSRRGDDERGGGNAAYRRTGDGAAGRDLGAAVREAVVRGFERVFGFAAVKEIREIPAR